MSTCTSTDGCDEMLTELTRRWCALVCVCGQDDASDAGRIANIKEVAPGESRVSFRIIVSQTALAQGDLQFVKFKGKAYPGSGYVRAPSIRWAPRPSSGAVAGSMCLYGVAAAGVSQVSFRCSAAGGSGSRPERLRRQKGAAGRRGGGGSWGAQRGLSPLLDLTDCSEEFGDCITDEDQVPFY